MTKQENYPFGEINKAYKAGKRAGKKGCLQSANPYPPDSKTISRSYTDHGMWIRGWLAGKYSQKKSK